MAELRKAQERRRTLRRGGVVAIFVVIALFLALYSSHTFPFSKSKSTNVATSTPTTLPGTTSTTVATSTTTVPAASSKPLSLSALEAHLVARSAPPHSATCAKPMTGSTSGGTATSTTTVAASGNAVSIVRAPTGVGFPKLDGSAPRYTKFASAPPFCIDPSKTYKATFTTTAGTFVITLLPKYAPQTVDNFVFLAGYHYFDGTVFHRVIPGFVDQGGDPTASGSGSPGYTIADENPKSIASYDNGAFAMANTGSPHSGGSQFFIVIGNGGQSLSHPTYADFGQVTSGLSVAKKINDGGNSAGNGVPPKVLYKIDSVRISVSAAK